MRIIVYGMGAIGGCVAALLARTGTDVIGIARGAQLEAIRAHGLRLKTPEIDEVVALTCVNHPSEITFRPDDAILLCMKTQATEAALNDLRDAGVDEQPIICLQNGVTNEELALRKFPNVHGAVVIMPSSYVEPGKVACHGAPRHGLFDLGRYPRGSDAVDTALATLFDAAGIASFVHDDVMRGKYGKLLVNLGNIVNAALGTGAETGDLVDRLRAEGRAVYAAAGIAHDDRDSTDPRRSELLNIVAVPGEERFGSSTTQSLLRGTGSIETDWLNGEIVRLGRLHGVPVPLNAAMVKLAARLVRDGLQPGDVTLAEIEQSLPK